MANTVAISWPFYPSVLLGILLLAGGYLLAITRWRHHFPRSAPVPAGRVVAFFVGLGCLFIALQTPLDPLSDDYLFSAHMVQHLLLTLFVPPFLLLGTPGWLVRPLVARWPRLVPLGRCLAHPVLAFALFNGTFIVYHFPNVYSLVGASELLHISSHLIFLATGVITWWPVLSCLEEVPAIPPPAQMLYIFAQTFPTQILGAVLTFADSPLYARYTTAPRLWDVLTPLADQQLGGLIMWVGGSTYFLVAFAAIFLRWAQLSEAADNQRAPSRA